MNGWASIAADLTPAGVVGIGVLMMMFGWLVPARMVRTLLDSKDKVISEQRAHINTQERAINALLRGNTATEAVISATAEVLHRGGAVNEPG